MITLGKLAGPWIPPLPPRPTKATTGVPAGVSLTTFSGTPDGNGVLRLTTPNTTYTGILFPYPVLANANGLVFQSCKFMPPRPAAGGKAAAAMVSYNAAGVTVPSVFLDCEFHGNGEWSDTASGTQGVASGSAPDKAIGIAGTPLANGLGYTMRRCYLHELNHCLDLTSNVTVESCYMDNPIQFYSGTQEIAHNDILQFFGTGAENVVILNNVLDNYNYDRGVNGNTAAIQWGSYWVAGAKLKNILIAGNYLNGGGYTFNGLGHSLVENVDVERLLIIRNRWGLSNQFGPNSGYNSRVTWADNVFDVGGTTKINNVTSTVTAGQAVT